MKLRYIGKEPSEFIKNEIYTIEFKPRTVFNALLNTTISDILVIGTHKNNTEFLYHSYDSFKEFAKSWEDI